MAHPPPRPPRVRFAPSPTGPLHIGGLRTALFNYLFAKKQVGTFVLRIEDTDSKRQVAGAEAYIFEALKWCGIEADESPKQGGPYGPYKQSERKDYYRQEAQRLVSAGKAYYAFDTPEELDALRQALQAEKAVHQHYHAGIRHRMKNSFTLSEEALSTALETLPYTIRLCVPPDTTLKLHDLIRGEVIVEAATMEDKVLLKADGMPTYHFANVLDDVAMKITHVIRGEEWLPSTPLHVLLYEMLGWTHRMPVFAHLPLLLKPDGKGKLSKRDAQTYHFPIYPLPWKDEKDMHSFRAQGYLPEGLLNFLAFLGWSPKGEREVFDLRGLLHAFALEDVTKGGARFDMEKARWFNAQHVHALSPEDFLQHLARHLPQGVLDGYTSAQLLRIAALIQPRMQVLSDVDTQGRYFFCEPVYAQVPGLTRVKDKRAVLQAYMGDLKTNTDAKALLFEYIHREEQDKGRLMQCLRFCLTGQLKGLDLQELVDILSTAHMLKRIRGGVAYLAQEA